MILRGAVRRLPAAEDVTYRVIGPATFQTELEALFAEEYSDAYISAEDAAFTRLGLLGVDDDLKDMILGLYDSQVLAFYDPRTTTFSLIGPVDKIVGELQERRDRWGFSYIIVGQNDIEPFAPVVAALAGT